jgi:hypothetical protein
MRRNEPRSQAAAQGLAHLPHERPPTHVDRPVLPRISYLSKYRVDGRNIATFALFRHAAGCEREYPHRRRKKIYSFFLSDLAEAAAGNRSHGQAIACYS